MSCKIDLGEKKKPCGCEAGWHPLYPWDSSEAIWQSGSVYFKRLAQRKRGFYDWTRLMLNITHWSFLKTVFSSLSLSTQCSRAGRASRWLTYRVATASVTHHSWRRFPRSDVDATAYYTDLGTVPGTIVSRATRQRWLEVMARVKGTKWN